MVVLKVVFKQCRLIFFTSQLNFFKVRTGSTAKFFLTMNCHVILLWKAHKLSPDQLKECNINDIPVGIVQAAGKTYLIEFYFRSRKNKILPI